MDRKVDAWIIVLIDRTLKEAFHTLHELVGGWIN